MKKYEMNRNNFLLLGMIYQEGLAVECGTENVYAQNFYKLYIRSHPFFDDYLSIIGREYMENEIKDNTSNFDKTCRYNQHLTDVKKLFEKLNTLRWDEYWQPVFKQNKKVREMIASIDSKM